MSTPTPDPERRTGLIWHERFAWYQTGIGAGFVPAGGLVQPLEAADAPPPKTRFRSLVDVSGLEAALRIRPAVEADEEELRAFHAPEYLRRLAEMEAAGHGEAGRSAPVGPDGYRTARLAAGGCGVAIDEVLSGRADNAFALVRPPGHHARRDEGIGSCLLANAVLAALRARRLHGVERIAILDWDVHHGNGTQEAFWDDPAVLTVSIHQDGFFPSGSGGLDERGGDGALGANVNVPLPPGSGHGAYLAAVDEVVLPAIRRHRPDLLLVACGLDASALDPLGRMLLHSGSFRALGDRMVALADELCDGRLVMVQEGGYSAPYTPFCGVAVLEGLAGVRVVEDPFLDVVGTMPGQSLTRDQRAAVDAARAAAGSP